LRYRSIFLVALILLNGSCWIQVAKPNHSVEQFRQEKTQLNDGGFASVSECDDEIGEMLMRDDFTSSPIGFNNSLWNLRTCNNPTLTWSDGELHVLNSEKFTYTTLESVLNTGPEVIAEFNISFTGGLSYFGIGWADKFQDPVDNWISNLRVCQNGVFIDYWDDELLLVSYSEGKGVSTIISDVNVEEEHLYTLIWSESLVRLSIDKIEYARISRHVPAIDLPFMITTSGHHYRVLHDQLTIDSVGIYTRDLCQSQAYPKISLIWPANTSTIYYFDDVDIEIEGESGDCFYSWDGGTNTTFISPWDIPVVPTSGFHHLEVYAEDSEDNWSKLHLVFTVVYQEVSLLAPDSEYEPLIDGIVSSKESESFTKIETSLRGEDRCETPFDLFIGYHNNSLYIGVLSTVPDRYHSKISLCIDGQGSGVWGDAELGTINDILITIPTPSADEFYKCITTHYDQEVNPLGIVYDSGISEACVAAEFLIPVQSVSGNSTIGLGISIIVSQGGYDSFYPCSGSGSEYPNMLIIRSSGPRLAAPMDGFVFSFLLVVGGIFIALAFIVRPRKLGIHIEVTIADEDLERIRTLLYSHPEISMDRLALLANTDTKSVRTSIDKLAHDDLLTSSVTITERGVVRGLGVSEKKQK
jgi:hypothetical protein